MNDDRLRLRRSLDPHSLVRIERGADRQHKNSRLHRPHSIRHLVRTPLGAAVAVGVLAATGVSVAFAVGGSGPARPAAGFSPQPPPAAQPSASGQPPAVPGVNLPPSLPDPCQVLTRQQADAVAGKSLHPITTTPTFCAYGDPGQTRNVGFGYLHGDAVAERALLTSDRRPVSALPELGPVAFFSPAFDRPDLKLARTHTCYPASVYFPVAGQLVTVFVGSSDGSAHATDPPGDLRRAVALAKALFPQDAVSGA